ncbi:MAG: hypothetical protein WKF99_07080 [Solirubrobacteraceae bacterium]|jgi:cyclopropane fatty-acyl-phospholipid synthase-like methyltransferase
MAELPAPLVPPEAYTKAYYRESCMGARAWSATGGAGADALYARRSALRPGDVLVDVGCGRGELLVEALRVGRRGPR